MKLKKTLKRLRRRGFALLLAALVSINAVPCTVFGAVDEVDTVSEALSGEDSDEGSESWESTDT